MIKFGIRPQLHVDHWESSKNRRKKDILVPEKLEPVANESYGWCKPVKGGLWTSSLIGNGWSEWCRWTKGEDFMYTPGTDAFILTISPTAKIFEINGRDDVKWLKDRYKFPDPTGFPKDLTFLRLDWIKIAQDFDGVNLTKEGNSRLHLGALDCCLNAWDVESTIWLRWAFDSVTPTKISDPEDEAPKRKITLNA